MRQPELIPLKQSKRDLKELVRSRVEIADQLRKLRRRRGARRPAPEVKPTEQLPMEFTIRPTNPVLMTRAECQDELRRSVDNHKSTLIHQEGRFTVYTGAAGRKVKCPSCGLWNGPAPTCRECGGELQ